MSGRYSPHSSPGPITNDFNLITSSNPVLVVQVLGKRVPDHRHVIGNTVIRDYPNAEIRPLFDGTCGKIK